jgi:hypothetical protein
MGKLALSLASKTDDLFYVHAQAESPAFTARTSFYCKSQSLVEFGKKLKGFPRNSQDTFDFSIGDAKRKADFNFHTVVSTGQCELWIRIKGIEDEQGKSAEAYFPIDYLDAAAIDSFSRELLKLGTGHSKSAEIKNKFENS